MSLSCDLPRYRYSACAISICLCIGWPHSSKAACTLTPTVGNDSFVCDSASSGPLTDLSGNNTLTFPATGNGTLSGNVTFGAGADRVIMGSGRIVGVLDQGDGADFLQIDNGQITGAVRQNNGIDTFIMNGGSIQSLAQGDGLDRFLMTGGTIVDAFEDGDIARMTGGTIGRVDMKLDDNTFDLSGGQIVGNLVTGFGTDTLIVSGGRIGGNVSVSGGNDSITVTGGEIAGEIRASTGNDTLLWSGGGIIRSAILMGDGNDTATLANLDESTLSLVTNVDGGSGTDLLTFDHSTSAAASRYTQWETVTLNRGSRFDLTGNFVLGDNISGSGVFNIDGSSTLISTQGSFSPFTANQRVTLNNAGTIDLSRGNIRTNDTLTVQGNYSGNAGRLLLQSTLDGDNSPSDKLVVNNGAITGSTLISVSNVGGLGGLTLQDGIQVVRAQGTTTSGNGAFAMKEPVSAGAYDYFLFRGGIKPGTENSWYLRSAVVAPEVSTLTVPQAAAGTPPLPVAIAGQAPIPLYRPEVPTWSVLPPAAAQLSLMALGTFHDRQGDQDLLKETGAFGAGWGRIYGKNFDQTWAGTVSPRLDGSLDGFQVGNDLLGSQTTGGQTWRTGLFVGHSHLRGDVDGFHQGFEGKHAGKVELEGDSYGLYWTLTDPHGWYVDTVAMGTRLEGDNRSDRGVKLDNRGHAVTLSAEAGYPFAVTGDWVMEPQLQVVHQKVSLDSQDDGISRVSFDSDSAWTGRLGVRLKGRYTLDGQPLEPYLRANLWHTLSGTDTVTFGTDQIETRQKSTSADLGIGVLLGLAPAVSIYAGVDVNRDIDSNSLRGVTGNVGVRIGW
ncbi:autotransporter outer membrane beta-barrel domain-containing protein [Pseudomonas migulae]|uniref:autotransporter family protein n=1 Tax=Pseudomonas migulae TaxID=78543 RepID=UPI00371426DA